MVLWVALFLATLIPLLAFFLMYRLDFYRTGSGSYILLCLGWGVLSYALASLINPAMIHWGWVDFNEMVRFSAPVLEEILKGLLLFLLVQQVHFTYFVDGAIYGFAAGVGFAIFENYEYVTGRPELGMAIAASRVLSTNLIHATGSAVIGITLGLVRFERSLRARLLWLGGGLGLAMGIHIGFNNMVSQNIALIFAILAGFMGAVFIAWLIRRGLEEERRWLLETLGMRDQVTRSEARIVHEMENMDEMLELLASRLGTEKVRQVKAFLRLQARLGLLRKNLEMLSDSALQEAIRAAMEDLRQEINRLRRQVGSYEMLYLRHVFKEDGNPLWDRLEQILQEREGQGIAGGGLWQTLDVRLKTASREVPHD
ncbi:MAG: PrsW family glutamic-type intramembrane protease [Anaerolineales bacterium]